MLANRTFFRGFGSRRLKVDPTGLELPTLTLDKVYTLDTSGDIALAAADSDIVLGVYVGTTESGFLLFEQAIHEKAAAYTSKGTRWYLAAAGGLTSTPGTVLFGIALSADKLWILPSMLDGGGGGPPPA